MTPERLQQLAERYDDEMIRPEHVAELLVAVDHLTAEVERLRADVRSLQRGSQRNADAHMVTHRDNARLRAGIEALADSWEPVGGRWLQQMDSEDHVRVDCGEQMLNLLNPPTEGES